MGAIAIREPGVVVNHLMSGLFAHELLCELFRDFANPDPSLLENCLKAVKLLLRVCCLVLVECSVVLLSRSSQIVLIFNHSFAMKMIQRNPGSLSNWMRFILFRPQSFISDSFCFIFSGSVRS